jgi:hypothetical protein
VRVEGCGVVGQSGSKRASLPPSALAPPASEDDPRSKHNASEKRRAQKIKDGIEALKALMEVCVVAVVKHGLVAAAMVVVGKGVWCL